MIEIGSIVYHTSDIKKRHPMTVVHITDYGSRDFWEYQNSQEGMMFPLSERDFEVLQQQPVKVECHWLNSQRKLEKETLLLDEITT